MIVLTGENTFMLGHELQTMRDGFITEHGELAYEELDGGEASYTRMHEAVNSLPFLASAKLVVIAQGSASNELQEKIAEFADSIAESTTVVLVESKLDKRGKFFKWLKANTDFREFVALSEVNLVQWVVAYAKDQGGVISSRDASYLVQRVGLNQLRLSHEIEKLVLAQEEVTKPIIDLMTEPMPQSKIFDLLDAAFAGQTKRALTLYEDQRSQKVDPHEILAMMAWQLRQIALAKTAKQHSLTAEAKMNSFSAQKAQRVADRLTLVDLRRLVDELTTLDVRSKQSAIDLDSALKAYILRIT